jgi:hypothetical protein
MNTRIAINTTVKTIRLENGDEIKGTTHKSVQLSRRKKFRVGDMDKEE